MGLESGLPAKAVVVVRGRMATPNRARFATQAVEVQSERLKTPRLPARSHTRCKEKSRLAALDVSNIRVVLNRFTTCPPNAIWSLQNRPKTRPKKSPFFRPLSCAYSKCSRVGSTKRKKRIACSFQVAPGLPANLRGPPEPA